MKSTLYTLSFLLGAVAVNAQMTDRQTSPARKYYTISWNNDDIHFVSNKEPEGLAFAAANDRQTSPIGK